jgi:hypothetical protein
MVGPEGLERQRPTVLDLPIEELGEGRTWGVSRRIVTGFPGGIWQGNRNRAYAESRVGKPWGVAAVSRRFVTSFRNRIPNQGRTEHVRSPNLAVPPSSSTDDDRMAFMLFEGDVCSCKRQELTF